MRYLGRLRATAAITRLGGLLGVGNPYALRIAAIDALGQIASPTSVKLLFSELHSELFDVRHAASRALAGIDAPSLVAPVMELLVHDRGAGRPHLLIALLGTARALTSRNLTINALVRQLATASDNASASAATLVLAALATNPNATSDLERTTLRQLAVHGVPSVRAAALRSLVDDPSSEATTALLTALASPIDQIGAAAAYALGRRSPVATVAITNALQRAVRRSEWATAISASAALWRIGQRQPALLVNMVDTTQVVLFHQSRLVRSNAARLLLQQPASLQRNQQLLRLVQQDDSTFVRTSATQAIRLAGPSAALSPELQQTVSARVGEITLAPPAAEVTAWRLFDIVVGNGSNQPARTEPYFFVLPSGLVEAAYSDDTGTITLEHFVAGQLEFAARTSEDDL